MRKLNISSELLTFFNLTDHLRKHASMHCGAIPFRNNCKQGYGRLTELTNLAQNTGMICASLLWLPESSMNRRAQSVHYNS